jgi:hypothetical protein
MLPWSSHSTTTTFMPAMTALAGLVPWAELGIRQTSRWPSPRRLVGADDQQPGVLALGAGVGLQRDGGEAGDLRQPGGQLVEHLL